MHLWGVSMVRNEADIVEAFVRHNLAFLDGLVVLDHRSVDPTRAILQRLKAEGLKLILVQTGETAFFQGGEITRIASEAFQRTSADFVFALDADEFIRAASREALEAALAGIPLATHGRIAWLSYVPDAFDRPFGPHCVRHHLREERILRHKLVIRRGFVETGAFMVSEGNHWVLQLADGRPASHHAIAPELVRLAHCPVRSRAQLEAKTRVGFPALRAAGGQIDANMAYHWRELYEDLQAGIALTDDRLRMIAANYTVPRADWVPSGQIDLVEDPLILRGTGNGAA